MQYIDKIIKDMADAGCQVDTELFKKALCRVQSDIKKDISMEDVMRNMMEDLTNDTESLLENTVSGIETSIYLPYSNDKIAICGGQNKFGDGSKKIDFDTRVDVASITKFFSAVLIFRLRKLGILSLCTEIGDMTSHFAGVRNYTIGDIMRMAGEIRTPGRIADLRDASKIEKLLRETYIYNPDKGAYTYSDIGLMILAYALEDYFEKLGTPMRFDEIMKTYVFDELGLKDATFSPNMNGVVMGNGDGSIYPHDMKARYIRRPVGHAGIFISSIDMEKVSKVLVQGDFILQHDLRRFSKVVNANQNKGNFGAFVRRPNGLKETYRPSEYSFSTFAFEGYTGSIYVLDYLLGIHNHILVGAIDNETNLKREGYRDASSYYQEAITEYTLELAMMRKHFDSIDSCEKGFVLQKKI